LDQRHGCTTDSQLSWRLDILRNPARSFPTESLFALCFRAPSLALDSAQSMMQGIKPFREGACNLAVIEPVRTSSRLSLLAKESQTQVRSPKGVRYD